MNFTLRYLSIYTNSSKSGTTFFFLLGQFNSGASKNIRNLLKTRELCLESDFYRIKKKSLLGPFLFALRIVDFICMKHTYLWFHQYFPILLPGYFSSFHHPESTNSNTWNLIILLIIILQHLLFKLKFHFLFHWYFWMKRSCFLCLFYSLTT